MRRILMTALALGVLTPGTARAQVKVAVFDLEADAGGQKVATGLTSSLRRLVANQSGMVLAPGKSLAEIRLVFGCADRPVQAFHQCLAKVGTSLKADRIVLGRVRKKGGSFRVVITLLDVRQPLRPRTVSETIGAGQAAGAGLEQATGKWWNTLLGIAAEGKLRVSCNVPGATVRVDGRVAGQCDAGGMRITAAAGTRKIEISHPGFTTAERVATVKAGETTEIEVALQKAAGAVPVDRRVTPPEDRRVPPGDGVTPPKGGEKTADPTLKWKVLFYSTVGAGAALLVASIFTGMQVKSLEKDKEAEIIASWDDPDPTKHVTDTKNACKNNRGNTALVDICNKGANMATVTNALIGVGAVLVAGSGFFLYKAYFDKSSKEKAELTPTAPARPRFVVTPEIWERGGGVSATLRF